MRLHQQNVTFSHSFTISHSLFSNSKLSVWTTVVVKSFLQCCSRWCHYLLVFSLFTNEIKSSIEKTTQSPPSAWNSTKNVPLVEPILERYNRRILNFYWQWNGKMFWTTTINDSVVATSHCILKIVYNVKLVGNAIQCILKL